MIKITSEIIDNKSIAEKYLISLAVLLYILRTAIPLLKFPFLLIYSFLLIYILISYRKSLVSAAWHFLKTFYLIIILAAILLLAFLLSNKLYLSVFKDLVNALILILFAFTLDITVRTKKDLKQFIFALINLVIFFGFLISVVRLVDLLNIFYQNENITLYQIPYTIEVGSLPVDYNFAILPVFLSMISLIFLLSFDTSRLRVYLFNFILIACSLSIFFSGSRRGLLVLSALVIIILTSRFVYFDKYKKEIKAISKNTGIYLIAMLFLTFSALFVVYNTSYSFKNRLLENIGSKNLVGTKGEIAHTIFRYMSVFNKSVTYPDVYNTIWTPGFDPRDPDSGWGSRFHKSVYPLSGENVSIVPGNTKGYYMDHTSNADTLNRIAYSATWIYNHEFNENIILDASVYCYLSDSCNASTVMICSLGAMGNPGALYDLDRKGVWQKLQFSVNGKNGSAGILLYFSQNNAKDFSSLGGHVIYAYPEIKIIDKRDGRIIKSTSLLDEQGNDQNLFIKSNNFLAISKKSLFDQHIKAYSRINYCEFGSIFVDYLGFFLNSDSIDNDPVRRFASKLISEDTTYFHHSAEISVGTPSFDYILGRTLRWQFAWMIFMKEFSFGEKMFGGGFNFLNWFGNYFFSDKTKSDYPHNPLLSILLYSGIIGLIIYLIFLGKIFIIILKYYQQYFLISLFFLITFFFSFFSSGSPFDPPILGFFSILIILIGQVHREDISNETEP